MVLTPSQFCIKELGFKTKKLENNIVATGVYTEYNQFKNAIESYDLSFDNKIAEISRKWTEEAMGYYRFHLKQASTPTAHVLFNYENWCVEYISSYFGLRIHGFISD
ncbi:uncharacterized protein LOC126551364 isoform X3 [Aphis gossypii]|uniref:uncharacterized protein LOC126551364 isoform X1 n=1 Tax=Aphis gossypii TaxID=80765 RepID=UPI0021591625|nr:uncharacterized protein LOC126551364 isoform X1 [Aphis gossypii]XP_050060431.1 uncharacterized protein LOC126551364 isoform X2 [Aphis gossypii]XP_050060432.1 uncharacterized protein LOC126551364 isoform X3 [Aphis gossypii]